MSKIVGNYELTMKLGSGSYAQVYKCIHSKSGAPYAIKAISKEKVGDPKLMENLEQEISIMRDYLHPNIVQLFEHFSSSRYIYLVLELCPGGDLSKFIKKFHRIDEYIAQGFLRQLSDGLHFLQGKNVIHRDLKPANVLLSEFSNQAVLKIADFGFAKHLVEASMAQTPCGSPLYMAPEIFEMQEYDAKADIWSVGCVFYEMLVGAPPFKGSNPRELFQNIRTKPLQIPNDVTVGPQSVSLLKKLLERNPRRRASMDQFCAACTSLPITQTSTAVREEKAKLLQLDKQSKNSVVENPRPMSSGRDGDNSDAVNREGDLKGSPDNSDVALRSYEGRVNAMQSTSQGNEMNDSAMDRNRNNLQSQEQQQSQSFHQQMQQQQQQQQPYRWSNESAGEPLSRRHSVDSSPKIQIQGPLRMDGSRIHPSYTGPDRSAYSPGVSSSRAGEMGDRDDGNFQRMNSSSSGYPNQNQNQSQYLSQNQNQSHHQLHHQQQQRPSMASSLLAEGLSRMMDFLSKSPSQKSSIPQQQQPQRSPNMSNNHQNQGYSNQQPGAYGGRNRASSYSDVDSRSRSSANGGFEGSDSIRTPTQSHISQRKHGYQNQNVPSNEEHRRARMASVFEEKEIPKGMRLSGSDEGFVLVDPSPLPAPPHPWRGATAGNANIPLKNTHSTSGKSVSSGPIVGVSSGAQGYSDGMRDSESTSGKYRNQGVLGPNQSQIQGSGLRAEQQLQLQQVDYAGSITQQQQQKQLSAMESQHLRLPITRDKYNRNDSSPSQSDNEKILIAGVTQQAEYVCQVVLCIVSVGDGLAEDIMQQEKNNQGPGSGSKGRGPSSRSPRPRGDSSDGPTATLAGACALYLHCVALVKDMLQRVGSISIKLDANSNVATPTQGFENQTQNQNQNLSPNQMVLEKHKEALLVLFDQLLCRVDQCYRRLLSLSLPLSSKSVAFNKAHSLTGASPPTQSPQWGYLNGNPGTPGTAPSASPGRITAEPLMYRAAVQLARDASVEELLGNLETACENYTTARLLIEGVLITAYDPTDRETLQQFVVTFNDQLAHCHQLLESHIMLLPAQPKGTTKQYPLWPNVSTNINNNNNNNLSQGVHNNQLLSHQNQYLNLTSNLIREGSLSIRESPGDTSRPLSYDHTQPL